MEFEILGDISNIEKIAVKTSIRDLQRLRRMYGKGRWRKLKGMARIQLPNGKVREWLRCTGTKPMESAEEKSDGNATLIKA